MTKKHPVNSDLSDPTINPKTGETRVADVLTVVWMLTVMQVLLFELATVGFRWYFARNPERVRLGAFADLLYLCAALGGCISLLLLPLVWRIRRTKPPLGITLFAAVVAALPIVALLLNIGMARQ
jgi:hypothetical protein